MDEITHSKPSVSESDLQAVSETLASGFLSHGLEVEEFERSFASHLGSLHCTATTSCSAAIVLALRALGVGPGDEVVLPTYVCHEVRDAVQESGAWPVLCDVSERWTLDVDTVRPHLTPRTKAILAVHVFGIAADVSGLATLEIPIIEDVAQAVGARHGESEVGTIAPLAVYSFNAIKCLTTGEGGALVANTPGAVEAVGEALAEGNPLARMTDLQAALGCSQLKRYGEMLARRKALAERYFAALGGLPVALPYAIADCSMFFRFPLRQTVAPFDEMQALFARRGVQVRRGVDALLHREISRDDGDYPTATRLFEETVSLPIYPALSDDDQARVIDAAREAIEELER